MRKGRNADHLRRRRIVAAAVFWTMLRKELIQHVEAKVRRAENAAVRKRSPDVERQLDQMVERAAQLLEIRFYVRQDRAPLRGCVTNRAAPLIERIIILRGGGVAGQEDVS